MPPHTATLTRLRLNLRSPSVRRDLADLPQLHRSLMRLVPDELGPRPRQSAGLLFRLEYHARQPILLIQTAHQPRLEGLPPTYASAETCDLSRLFASLAPQQRVHYRITAAPLANRPHTTPAKMRADGTLRRPRGTRTPLRGPDALAWWQRRAQDAGLTIEAATLTPRPFPRKDRTGGPHHHLAQFDGTARIHDPHTLADALCAGIGQGKPYGAGLLILAPA